MSEVIWDESDGPVVLSCGDVRLEYVPREQWQDYNEEMRLVIGERSFRIIPQVDSSENASLDVMDEQT